MGGQAGAVRPKHGEEGCESSAAVLGPLSWRRCSVGTQGRAWPSGLQGGRETSREGTRIHSRERCPGAQGAGGREPDAPQHLTPRGQAPAAVAQPALTQSRVSGPV